MSYIFNEQPVAFRLIFMLEFWERFGYYTLQGILTLYLMRSLGFSDTEAYYTFGAFVALIYGMVVVGGYIGDRVLGTKRTIVLGLITLAIGYSTLIFSQQKGIFISLGIICVGNGLFKANPSSLLSRCYANNDSRLHSGFTLYYMAVNLGSIIALIIGPYMASHFGYPYAYFFSSAGLVAGLLNYRLQRSLIVNINNAADQKIIPYIVWIMVIMGITILICVSNYLLHHLGLARGLIWLITIISLGIYCFYLMQENIFERKRMLLALVLMVEGMVFFILYQQMPTSLTLFAVHNVTPSLVGITFDPQSFQVLNPIWIVCFSPVLARWYTYLQQRNIAFQVPYKFALGMLCCGFSFIILYLSKFFSDDLGHVSAWWLVASYSLQSLGELLVSALGLAMIAELVPRSINGFVMGMWFLTSSIAGFLGATVAAYTALPKNINAGLDSLSIYTNVFAYIGVTIVFFGVCLWLLAKPLSKYSQPKTLIV